MKKILTALVLASLAATAFAQHHHRYGHEPYRAYPHYTYPSRYWASPAFVFGAAVTYELTRPTVVYEPSVVYVRPAAPAYYSTPPLCNSNQMIPPRGYRYEYRYDADLGCTQAYFVPLY
jgi:hypothetical protein